MLFAHYGNGQSLGATLVEDKDYKCGRTICYAIGQPMHQKFQELQQAANQAARALGISTQITVDGFIGAQTITLIRAIANRMEATVGALGESRRAFSKEVAAKNVPELIAAFHGIVSPRPVSTPQPTQPSPTIPTPTTTAPAQPGVSPMQPAADRIEQEGTVQVLPPTIAPGAMITKRKVPIGVIAAVIGGLAVVGTIIAVVAVKRSSPR